MRIIMETIDFVNRPCVTVHLSYVPVGSSIFLRRQIMARNENLARMNFGLWRGGSNGSSVGPNRPNKWLQR